MTLRPETLPNDVELLKEMLLKQQKVNERLESKISTLEEVLRLERHRRFGASSEKAPGQGELFDEAEEIAESQVDGDTVEQPLAESTVKSKPTRKPLPANLPRVRQLTDLSDNEKHCECGCQLTEIGEEVSEQLDIIPAKIQVIQHVRKKYACKRCEEFIKTANVSAKLLPKSNATPGTLAYITTAKYQDGLPLYRLSGILNRYGIEISRQTLSDWVLKTAEQLDPIITQLQQQLLKGSVLHCDETTVQVLKEPDKAAQSKSYMWVQKGGPPGQPVIRFSYDKSRSGDVPARLLKGYDGALMTDGYTGYNDVVRNEKLVHLCCMAHVRRKFVEAQNSSPKKGQKRKTSKADMGVSFIAKLYAVEKEHAKSDAETRYQARQEKSTKVLADFKAWIDKSRLSVLPKSKLGEALAYADKYWTKVARYVENGDWPIDNNTAENAIRPFVIGRKAWLFSNTARGANASAALYSLIETAKLNDLEPYDYLKWLFTKLPEHGESIEALMPWAVDRETVKEI